MLNKKRLTRLPLLLKKNKMEWKLDLGRIMLPKSESA